ncbi:MAG: S9 family peptidase [Gemmatimonadaceae bacterium]
MLPRVLVRTLCLALAFAPGLALDAQEKASDTLLTVSHYLDYETVSQPMISPDGARIVYTRRWVNKQEDKWETALWTINADGNENRFLAKGGGAVWSPDGTRIAYIQDGEPKGAQIFVRWMNAEGATSQVTRVSSAPASIKWSPDGRWIGFAMFTPKEERWAIDMPSAPDGAKWTEAPRYVNKLHYRADRQGFTETGFTHLFIVPADGGSPRQLTRGDWTVGARFDALPGGGGWDWMPDGKSIVFDGLMEADWDMRYRDSDLNVVDVASGKMRKLTPTRGTWTNPVVSPDGKWIAYAGYPAVKQTYRVADVYLMKADGSDARLATPGWDREPDTMEWASDGSGLYLAAQEKGSSQLFFLPAAGGTPKALTSGAQMLALGSISKGGMAAVVRTTAQEPPDVWRYSLKSPAGGAAARAQLTRVNEDMLAGISLGAVEEVWYSSTNGTKVQGWIVKPPGFSASKKYPMIMEIHGGPHGMYNVAFNYMFQNFAANGYVVLYTNPRGSTGYGTDFGNAINLRYPGVDYEDLMAGVDTVVGRGYIDEKSMFVGGCSGGGVLSSWVIGHTTRFAGAAVRCPVMNWLSFAGQTDVPFFTYNFFEKPYWEDPMKWLEQSSIMYVGNVQTPTVIMTGELDLRTPMPQSEEYYSALKMRGVPSALLRFKDEYHGTSSKPSNFMRTQLYMMSWYQKYAGKSVS